MRISDWSSDVCSSDLQFVAHFPWILIVFPVRRSTKLRWPDVPPLKARLSSGVGRSMRRQSGSAGRWRQAISGRTSQKVQGRPGSSQLLCEIGRAARGERGCQYVWITEGAGSKKKKKI